MKIYASLFLIIAFSSNYALGMENPSSDNTTARVQKLEIAIKKITTVLEFLVSPDTNQTDVQIEVTVPTDFQLKKLEEELKALKEQLATLERNHTCCTIQ